MKKKIIITMLVATMLKVGTTNSYATNPLDGYDITICDIDGLTWEQVSQRMGYDLRWVMRLHKRALSCLQGYG